MLKIYIYWHKCYFGHGDKQQPGEPSASLLVEHWAKQTFAKMRIWSRWAPLTLFLNWKRYDQFTAPDYHWGDSTGVLVSKMMVNRSTEAGLSMRQISHLTFHISWFTIYILHIYILNQLLSLSIEETHMVSWFPKWAVYILVVDRNIGAGLSMRQINHLTFYISWLTIYIFWCVLISKMSSIYWW